jgi:hypothetical protein
MPAYARYRAGMRPMGTRSQVGTIVSAWRCCPEDSARKGYSPFAPTSHLPGASISPPPFRNEWLLLAALTLRPTAARITQAEHRRTSLV